MSTGHNAGGFTMQPSSYWLTRIIGGCLSAALLFVPTIFPTQDLKAQSKASSITLQELRDHIFFLASDSLGGRRPDDIGYVIAARYAADQLKAAGVKPILKDAGGNDTYFQTVPLVKAKTVVDIPLTIKTADGEKSFEVLQDLKLQARGPSLTDVPVVFVGYGISEPGHGWNDLQNVDIKGKIVVLLMGAPSRDGKRILPDSLHSAYQSNAGSRKKVLESPFFRQNMPAAVLVVPDEEQTARWNMLPDVLSSRQIMLRSNNQAVNIPTGPAMVGLIKGALVETLFKHQKYSPVGIGRKELEGYQSFELVGVRVSFGLKTIGEDFESMNVVGMVPGTDPAVSGEYVTLGAHLDHVKPLNGQVCNGADDDASGSVGILEIAEAIAQQPPRRSVVFSLYTAEESGLLGSRFFVANCPIPVKNITVNLNLDMIGRSDSSARQSRKHYVIGSDKTNPELRRLIDSVNSVTVKWPLDFESEDRSMAGSDHMSFHKEGIPVAFFFSGRHEDLHLPTDDPENIDFEKMQKLTQLVYEVTVEIGNQRPSLRSVGQGGGTSLQK
jgi:Zn-dependent M28 family amino/carboxypeptidase